MNTDEFGHQWSSGHWYDKKLKITTKIQKPDQLMDKFKQRLNLHAIQIIGKLQQPVCKVKLCLSVYFVHLSVC